MEFVKEFKQLAGEKPITAEELASAKANRIRGYAQRFDSLSKITEQISRLWVLDLPLSELQQYTTGIAKVTLAEVNSAAQKYVQPSSASLLLVGDLAKFNSEIRALNLGKVVILGADGKSLN
jgi:zinc protease